MFQAAAASEHAKAIEATIADYVYGYLKADPERLALAFHNSARLFSSEAGQLETTETSAWLANVETRRQKNDIREADVRIDGIDIANDAAIAKTTLVFETFQFTDYLSLLYLGGRWTIVNKIYTIEKFS